MKNLEQKVYKYLKERNWHDLKPVDLAKSIMIEGAELLELFQWRNLPLDQVKQDKAQLEEIKKELADVMMYALEMSVVLGFDTEKIILKKLAYVKKKYPAKLMRKHTGTDENKDSELYWKIKREYRKNKNK
jgi:NTP pyrophosphatase (non-canonical NTP hydrolase)